MFAALKQGWSKIYDGSVFGMTERAAVAASSGAPGQIRSDGKVDNYRAWLGAPSSSAGVAVNHESAQSLTAVWTAVRIMAETIGSLSWDVIREDGSGNRTKLPRHRVAKLLRQPDPIYSGGIWMETMQAWASMRGNGISLIVRNASGIAIGLRHFPLSQVRIDYDPGERILLYTFRDTHSGRYITVDSRDVIHLRALVWDGENGYGKSPIQAHRDTIGLGLAGQQYMGGVMKNGAHIPGLLHTDQSVKPEVAAKMGKSWSEAYGGSVNSGKTPFLHSGVKYQQLSLSPADAQWLELNKTTVAEISRIFRIPLHMMSELGRSTNNNIEQQALEFVTNTLRPWVKKWEAEMDKLFTDREQGRVYFRFDLNSLLRGDVKGRATLYDIMLKWGAMSVDEVRRLEGHNAIATGEGATHLYPVNMAPFEYLGNFKHNPNGDQLDKNEEE